MIFSSKREMHTPGGLYWSQSHREAWKGSKCNAFHVHFCVREMYTYKLNLLLPSPQEFGKIESVINDKVVK